MRLRLLAHLSVIPILVFLSSPVTTQAQPSVCPELMKFGIHDEYNTLRSSEYFQLYKTWFCQSRFSSFEQAKSEANRLGIGVDIFSLNFNGVTAETNFSVWSERMCQSSFSTVQSNSQFIHQVRIISPALMGVLKQCLEGETKGLRTWISTTRDRTQVSFNARYVPEGEEQAEVLSFSVTPATVLNDCQGEELLAPGQTFVRATRVVTCAVNPQQSLTFTLNTRQGGEPRHIDSHEPFVPPPPPTASLAASPSTIIQGQSATLSWRTVNASSVSIEPNVPGVNGASGSVSVSPTSTTTYTLVALGAGSPAISSTTVQVTPPPPSATLTASATSIAFGQSVTLTWNTANASAIFLDQGIGAIPATGSRVVSPAATTTYTLVANSSVGPPASQSVTVQVNPKVRVFQNVGFSGVSQDINGPVVFNAPLDRQISSIQIFTDEWVVFIGLKGFGVAGLLIKGPKNLDNLHNISSPRFNHWGDAIWQLTSFSPGSSAAPSCDPCTTLP
jgi:hypothetical protein